MRNVYRAWWIPFALLTSLLLGPHVLPLQKALSKVVDPGMAPDGAAPFDEQVQAGQALFTHEWEPNNPLAAGGDGLGPVFNASSCAACYHQGGPGGGGEPDHNVTSFTVAEGGGTRGGVVHAHGIGYQETLQDIDPGLPAISRPSRKQLADVLILPEPPSQQSEEERVVFQHKTLQARALSRRPTLSQRNTPALFGAGLIDKLPEEVIVNNEKDQRLARARSQRPTDVPAGRAPRLADGRVGRFGWKAQTASLGDFVQAACANELGLGNPGHPQPRPLGHDDYPERGPDLTRGQCDQITAFVASLPRPVESAEARAAGKQIFAAVGCADCHTPDLGPVKGVYSDLLLHDMGPALGDGMGYYGSPGSGGSPGNGGPSAREWRTPPLWGAADSAPYLHDGRAETLEEAIRLHGGQGSLSARKFQNLDANSRQEVITFLGTLRAP